MDIDSRWSVRGSAEHVADLLDRAAEYLRSIAVGDAVRGVALNRDGADVVLTISFDHWKLPADLDYLDPSLAAQFHFGRTRRDDIDFMVALAAERSARTVLDFGCGTGQLAVALAAAERRVIGVDPAQAMLDLARTRPGADAIEWRWGDATAVDATDVDLVVMTGNIPSTHTTDEAWTRLLAALLAALRPGGCLAFGSWNPSALPWERRGSWDGMIVETIGEGLLVGGVGGGAGLPLAGGREALWSPSVWRYRTDRELTASLERTGFVVERLYGDWTRGPLTSTSPDIVVIAIKPA